MTAISLIPKPLNRSPVSSGCSEMEGLMMEGWRGVALTTLFPLHSPIWAWLSQSARYKVALTCSQPWGGAGQPDTRRQAGSREEARSQVS